MGKKSEFSIVRSFVKHVLRGGLRGAGAAAEAVINPLKLVDAVTGMLDEVIFSVLEEKAAKEDSQKLHEKLDRLLEEQRKGAEAREVDFTEVIAGLHVQADFNEKVEVELGKIVSLLKEPDKADVPKKFAAAVEKVLARDEELLEEFLNKLGVLSEEHAGLSSAHGVIVEKVEDVVEALGARIDAIRAGEGESKRKRKVEETRVSLAKLPATGRELFGRNKELMTLSRAWVGRKTKIISFVAWGGVGKTALVNEWLNRMGEKGWGGAECVYGWSFYSQGTKEDRQASSDEVLAKALEWFGDEETAKSAKSPWDKGVRLAELVRGQKTLLILDGVEPLQHPPGPMAGRLKDQGLQGLLRELSHGMDGLCVVTTREKIEDLEGQVDHTVRRVELENLSAEGGMQVLREAGVTKGTDKELKQASKEFGGHALALNLLGRYLAKRYGGEIRKRDKVPRLAYKKDKQGKHARNVMAAYEIWLGEENKAEIDILYLMGLFDRPADGGAIEALRKGQAIKGLTKRLEGISDEDWDFAVENLRELRLLGKDDGSGDLDCHPLVREHFGEKLKKERPGAWREGHGRLYEYYKGVPGKERPDTLEEMEPLFRAVYHGCAAGEATKVWEEVYWQRICRREDYFVADRLGAFGSWLGAAACFFQKVWDKPAAGWSEGRKGLVLNHAGSALRGVGRLEEALGPMKASLDSYAQEENWGFAARAAFNLSELYLTLGDVGKAVEYGRRCVEYADKSGDGFIRMGGRTALADGLHQAGDVLDARGLFEEAEQMQHESQPEYRYLYSLGGYRYCDLLLSLGAYEKVKERARQTLEWAKRGGLSLLALALDKLSIGRALLAEAASDRRQKAEGRSQKGEDRRQKAEDRKAQEKFKKARRWLDAGVDGLRRAGQQQELPRGLLARAGYWRIVGEARGEKERMSNIEQGMSSVEVAWRDLEEAREIAERGGMKLWLADYHLESARLARSEKDKEKMAEHYGEAKRLVEECGYHRRDGELQLIKDY